MEVKKISQTKKEKNLRLMAIADSPGYSNIELDKLKYEQNNAIQNFQSHEK